MILKVMYALADIKKSQISGIIFWFQTLLKSMI